MRRGAIPNPAESETIGIFLNPGKPKKRGKKAMAKRKKNGTKKGQKRKTARRAYVRKAKSGRKRRRNSTKKGQVRRTARRAYMKSPAKRRRRRRNADRVISWRVPSKVADMIPYVGGAAAGWLAPGAVLAVLPTKQRNQLANMMGTKGGEKLKVAIDLGTLLLLHAYGDKIDIVKKFKAPILVGTGLRLAYDLLNMFLPKSGFGRRARLAMNLPATFSYHSTTVQGSSRPGVPRLTSGTPGQDAKYVRDDSGVSDFGWVDGQDDDVKGQTVVDHYSGDDDGQDFSEEDVFDSTGSMAGYQYWSPEVSGYQYWTPEVGNWDSSQINLTAPAAAPPVLAGYEYVSVTEKGQPEAMRRSSRAHNPHF